ncbi:hypothetical protein HU200_006994 [Digitaria exilis]|uniref:RBR-type E3 ubiquitin transferase n=1 Tax=Digitaria exilis TaxID=1010633 RepID=A0A835KRE1_9POAL|nr:hypothetical protein HU200_006994 [Digitaria exilis]
MEAAAAADGDPYLPIYISSDEEDGHAQAYFTESYSPEEIEIQEAILLSLDPSRGPDAITSSSASPSSSRAIGVSNPRDPPPDRKGKRQISSEDGSSGHRKTRSKRSRFNCDICFEMVEVSEKFFVSNCTHAFCNSCVGRYVAGKVSENVHLVGCPDPDCENGVVDMNLCRDIVPPELFERWNVALCENLLGDDKLYCPFKDCSAVLINDGPVKIMETECPHCHRLFCARCHVPWHSGIKCEEFKKLGDDEKGGDDLNLKKLASKKKWQRCPKCKMYVSRTSGCLLIKCR